MAEGSRVRDPVHNFIDLTEKEVRLVATPLFQRLRRIRQLALASLVYPGALHTRFDHTLGVCHVAGLMAKALRLEPDEERLVRLAALLHDLPPWIRDSAVPSSPRIVKGFHDTRFQAPNRQ
jgi:HD superfamily phosphohydrolase